MITMHATFKRTSEGFVPMINLRGAKGQMMGARCPEGAYREFRTFTNEQAAVDEAKAIVARCAARFPEQLRAA